VAPAGEVGSDPLLQAGQAELLEATDLGLGEALARAVGERRPAPERKRLAQRLHRCLRRLVARPLE
jgi:hypothetical protein